MEHVSTLCAVSTIGIAATGFALGCQERSSFPGSVWTRSIAGLRNKRPSRVATPTDRSSFSSYPDQALAGRTGTTPARRDSRSSRDPTFRGGRVRGRRQTYTNPASQVLEDPVSPYSKPQTPGRPSSSWLRRISIISTQTESQWSSSRPTSSSINDSTTPILPRSTPHDREPNKLVKRSTSQNWSQRPTTARPTRPMSGMITLRRPATSHQRSAAVESQRPEGESVPLADASSPDDSTDAPVDDALGGGGGVWHPYFISVSDEPPEKLPWRHRDQDQSVRHVIPTPKNHPTLMLSTSLHTRHPDHRHDSSRRPVSIPRRPVFTDPFPQASRTPDDTAALPRSKENRRPRQSLSLGEISGGFPSRPKTTARTASRTGTWNGSTYQTNIRNVSNPLPQCSETIHPDNPPSGSHRLRRKRNFTDSSAFRRPRTAESPFAQPPETREQHMKSVLANSLHTRAHGASSGIPTMVIPCHITSPKASPPLHDSFDLPSISNRSSRSVVRRSHIKQLLVSTSDRASIVIGSDDPRVFTSGEEDETDFQSDSLFDSIRTRASTSSRSRRRGPSIDTIFNDLPASGPTKEIVTQLAHSMSRSSHSSQGLAAAPGSADDSLDNCTKNPTSSPRIVEQNAPFSTVSPQSYFEPNTSPPPTRALRHIHSDPAAFADDEGNESYLLPSSPVELDLPFRPRNEDSTSRQPRLESESAAAASSCRESSSPVTEWSDIRTRASVFDWSEHPRSNREGCGSGPRPKTVHGKQGNDVRGSRAPGRKAPTALHLRSQSVPVSRDSSIANDSRQPSSKFSTWGLGHKGVTEDWDGDFDFDDSDGHSTDDNEKMGAESILGGMKVPQAIMERQASVYGQFGHVQELTVLVEELKRLRLQGNLLHVVQGPSNDLWKEAEGIVNLATFEDEENGCSPPRSPSSRLSFDDFDSDSPPSNKVRKRKDSDMRRAPLSLWPNPSATTPPRWKDSTLKARTVLETIYQYRNSCDPFSNDTCVAYSQQKLPFDTQSLRDLVVRAGVVTRALKEVIRRAEGVATSSENEIPPDPPFSRIFSQPSQNSSLQLKSFGGQF
ncbi:hypothetical protein V8E54_001561 [Elaphomyces granulatus]